MTSQAAWLALSKDGAAYRRLGGGIAYEDDPASHYSWDSNVPNHATVDIGDVIALWDDAGLIGVSVIEAIVTSLGTKDIGGCPRCGSSSYEARKTLSPTYRCYNPDCGELFDQPTFRTVDVTKYRSNHSESWIDLDGLLDAPSLRSLCVSPKNQNSFRPLRIDDFRQAVSAKSAGDVLRILDSVAEQILGGHKTRVVRVRLGQGAFRAKLLNDYDEVCAFSGPAPAIALDACHLYSYAKVGEHKNEGGLLLRKDLHRLFDEGLILIDPDTMVLDVHRKVWKYPAYGNLHGVPLQVVLTPKQRAWLELHWKQWSRSR
ncbi:MAG: hypothetical protein JWR34_7402 [Mycobacterium sp.]|nr:hypothetical protein [Mycobacterium sp.]